MKKESTGPLSRVLVTLLKSVIYRDTNEALWRDLHDAQGAVRDQLKLLFLELIIDESEGYAFLRQIQTDEVGGEDGDIPRLVQRRPLPYGTSLMCVVLRRRLQEHDRSGGDIRLVLTRTEIAGLVKAFFNETTNEARLDNQISAALKRLVEYGILKSLSGANEDTFEVRRIIKALVDATWLEETNAKLEGYRRYESESV